MARPVRPTSARRLPARNFGRCVRNQLRMRSRRECGTEMPLSE